MTTEQVRTTLARPPERPERPDRPERPERHGPAQRRRPPQHPPKSSATSRRGAGGNVPQTLDSFLGRDDDLREIVERFERGRVVTITGAPGMGKTRLAVEAARSLQASFPAGTWLVQLAPVAGGAFVAPTVAAALGVAQRAGSDMTSDLAAHIGERRLLVVLDNCEHLLAGCAQLVAALVEECPHLYVLATSQERLAVAGEQVWALSGLPHAAPEAENTFAPAVQLFAERARSAVSEFEVTPDNLPAVMDVCRRLDGIPLAIELAAARVKTLTPAEIAHHLDQRFALLTGGRRSALPRHQTLKAAVDWSYHLLDDPEQTLLRRLSVFAGGAALEAVDHVCSGDGVGAGPGTCLDLLTNLVERSLVVPRVGPQVGAETRYGLLETIRFYGRDRMAEAGETDALAARHLRWCVELAEAAEPHLTGPEQQAWLVRLDADYANLRAALAYSLDHGLADQARRLAGSLAMFWRLRSRFAEGFDWIYRSLAAGDDRTAEAENALVEAKAHWGLALLGLMLGLGDYAGPAAVESLRRYEDLGDIRGTARALLLVGCIAFQGESQRDQAAALQRSIALARQAGDNWCLAQALAICGSQYAGQGDTATARPMLEEAVAAARTNGDGQSLTYGLVSLGRVAVGQGDYRAAEASFDQALSVSGDFALPSPGGYERAVAREGLAAVARGRGDYERARHLLVQAIEDASADVSTFRTVDLAVSFGRLSLSAGDLHAAEAQFAHAQGQAESLGVTSLPPLLGLGEVALARGDGEQARDLLAGVLQKAVAAGRKNLAAHAAHGLGDVARFHERDIRSARALHQQALSLRRETGDQAGVVESLEALGGLAATSGQAEKAARVFGAASAVRERQQYARPCREQTVYEADVERTRRALGADQFESAWNQGAQMPVDETASYVAKARGGRGGRPGSGLASLTPSERQVADLVAQRFTNPEIAERLFVSVYTVKTHLRRIFVKLEVSSRRELAERLTEDPL